MSAEFFYRIDEDIRKQYQDITDEKAEALVCAYYWADKKYRTLVDKLACSVLLAWYWNKKILICALVQALRNLKTSRFELIEKYNAYQILKREFDSLLTTDKNNDSIQKWKRKFGRKF